MFSRFTHWISVVLGHATAFVLALTLIIVWLITGPIFQFSNAWQLVINTGTTIVTFLMVFLLQHTQNRDTIAIHLKLDEIIRSTKGTHNELLKAEELPDEELEEMLKRYESLANQIRHRMKKGQDDTGTPELPS